MTFQGLIVPIPTQFDDRGEIDPARTAEFTAGIRAAGADRLFVLGSLGEFPSVTFEERSAVVTAVVGAAPRRQDVWVGTGAPSTREAILLSRAAEQSGARAVVVVPPYYLHPSPASIERYYRELRASVELPIYAYNIPSLVGYSLAPSLVHRLAADHVLAGVKDTSGNLPSVEGFLTGSPSGFEVFPGDDPLAAAAIARGAAGAVMGLANVLPKLGVALVRAAHAKEAAEVTRLQELVELLQFVVAAAPFPAAGKFLAGHVRGVKVGYRSPYDPLTPHEEQRVLDRWAVAEGRLTAYC